MNKLLYLVILPCRARASPHKQSPFFLIHLIAHVPETLLDGREVGSHLPEVTYTYARVIHRQSYYRMVLSTISFGRGGGVSWHVWVT